MKNPSSPRPVRGCACAAQLLSRCCLSLLLLACLAWSPRLAAETVTLVKDANPGTAPLGSQPRGFTTMGSTVYFFRLTGNYDGTNTALALFKTQGLAGNTVKVKDLPGGEIRSDDVVVAGGSTLYFIVGNGSLNQLWKSDGTESGTEKVTDLPNTSYTVRNLKAVTTSGSPRIYFNFTDDTNGEEIWTSDGTSAGTQMITDLSPGFASTPIDNDGPGAIVGSKLLFVYDDGTGTELWVTDGTAVGTTMLKDINITVGVPSFPEYVTEWDGSVIFQANDDMGTTSLWKTDGTEAGTTVFVDNSGALEPAGLSQVCGVGSLLYVVAWDQVENEHALWKVTPAGVVAKVAALPNDGYVGQMWAAGTRVFFSVDDQNGADATPEYFNELWTSDGTTLGTKFVKRLHAGEYGTGLFSAVNAALGSTTFFLARGEDSEVLALFKSDGTAAGTLSVFNDRERGELTRQLFDELPDYGGRGILASMGGNVYFAGVPASTGTPGGEPWKTNGTTTAVITSLNATPGPYEGDPQHLLPFGSGLFLSLTVNATGAEPAVTNGTSAGTVHLKDIRPGVLGSRVDYPVVLGSKVFFQANNGTSGREPWITDGTAAGTKILLDTLTGPKSGGFYDPVVMGSKVYWQGAHNELWMSDGTVANTAAIVLPANINYLNPGRAVIGSVLYTPGYVTNGLDPDFGEELVKTDGTTGGTVMVKDINPGDYGSSSPNHLTPVGSTLFFAADDGTHGNELWKSDGTAGGTVLVKDINPAGQMISGYEEEVSTPDPKFFDFNGTLYFVADDGTNGPELWKSDGTEAGTVMVKDINPFFGSDPHAFTALGSTLFFRANDGDHGEELWKTDGTEAGTVMVKDINPGGASGPAGDHGTLMVAFNGHVYFCADDGQDGEELWRSDGTASGTVKAVDIGPVGIGSGVDTLAVNGSKLFFSAGTDSTGGQELYMLQGQPPVAAADLFGNVAPATATTLDVLANDRDPDGNAITITALSGLPSDATVTHDGQTVSFTGGASFNLTGVNTFSYTISDGQGNTATTQVTVRTASQALVGTWLGGGSPGNPQVALTFLPNGQYFLSDTLADAFGDPGMEHGFYVWNETTNALTLTVKTDTDGQHGLSHPGGNGARTVTVSTAGDILTYTDSDGPVNFTRVAPVANPLVGSWVIDMPGDSQNAVVTFLDDGTYFFAEYGETEYDIVGDVIGQSGMERGTYTWDEMTGDFTASPTLDTTEQWGFSHPLGTVTIAITGSTLTFNDTVEGTFTFTRVDTLLPEIVVFRLPAAVDVADGAPAFNLGSYSTLVTVEHSFSIRNDGNVPLGPLTVTKDGTGAAMYSVVAAPVGPLAPGASTTFTVRFAPTTTGVKPVVFHLASNDRDEASFDIALTATATVPSPGKVDLSGSVVFVNEEDGNALIAVVRSGGTDGDISATVTPGNGSALAGSDFDGTPQTVTFLSGEGGPKLVFIPILDPSSTPEPQEMFTLTLGGQTGGATLGALKTATVVILDSADAVNPATPSISAPAAALKIGVNDGGTVQVSGTVSDDQQIAGVEASLDNGATYTPGTVTLTGMGVTFGKTATFNVNVTPLVGGPQTVLVRAIDREGNRSTLAASRSFTVLRPLKVELAGDGAGTVSPGFRTALSPFSFREIGTSYTILATPTLTPAPGSVFDGWTVTGATLPSIGVTAAALELPSLTFTFREGLELVAKFKLNPFSAEAGKYYGLVRSSTTEPTVAGTTPDNSTEGHFFVELQSTGAFSGKLTMDGLVLNVNGLFDNSGMARFGTTRATHVLVSRPGKPSLRVNLKLSDLDTPGTADTITGQVKQNYRSVDTAVSDIVAYKAVPLPLANHAHFVPTGTSALYTAIMIPRPAAQQGPAFQGAPEYFAQGTGYLSITLKKDGTVTFAGVLADGTTPTSFSSAISKDLLCPVFSQLYNKLGFISGLMKLENIANSDMNTGMEGMLWARPYQDVQYYEYGWPEVIKVDLEAAKYIVPAAGTSVITGLTTSTLPPNPNARLEFSEEVDQVVPDVTKLVNISAAEVVTKLDTPVDANFTLKVERTTALISGTFLRPGDTVKSSFKGIIYQKGSAAAGYGHYLTPLPLIKTYDGHSGTVLLTPQ